MIVDKDRPAGYLTDVDPDEGYSYVRIANFFKPSCLGNENVTRDLYSLCNGEIVCDYWAQSLIR